MEQDGRANLLTSAAPTSRWARASAHLQRHKQTDDGGAHMAPTDPAGWVFRSPGLSTSGARMVTLRAGAHSGWGPGKPWATEYGCAGAGVGQVCAVVAVVGGISLLGGPLDGNRRCHAVLPSREPVRSHWLSQMLQPWHPERLVTVGISRTLKDRPSVSRRGKLRPAEDEGLVQLPQLALEGRLLVSSSLKPYYCYCCPERRMLFSFSFYK